MPCDPTKFIWMDGELVPWEEAKVHVLTHGLHYGTGVFEGIRAYETKRGAAVFRLTDHIERLFRSAHIYLMEIPFRPEDLIDATKGLVRANELKSSYIRPIVFRGYGEMGLNPQLAPVNVSIICWSWGAYLGEDSLKNGVRMTISSWVRLDPNILPPAAKATGQYLNSALAKVEAKMAGFDEAIMLNPDGKVSEATGENIFIIRDGVLVTPPSWAGALGGITRDSVIKIADDLGLETEQADLVRTDLYTADEMFLTGTAAEVVPVREIDGRKLGEPGPITKKIQEVFLSAVKGEVDQYSAWNEYVN
jgi:branched-chain amino acid aminotransferase